jgi:hypothetical protein
MKYAKPEVVASNSALEVIASVLVDKTKHLVTDRDPANPIASAGAYEADE